MGDFNWSDILPIVIVASTVLTVAVGFSGLRQGHYRSGKLTRRGRQTLAAIVALGIITLITTFADRQISAAKEAADAELRTRQFDRQMASLQGVTGDLGTVRGSLQESLRKQEQLYGVASESVRQGAALQAQGQENTLSVLRRVFQEGNRVAAERIAIAVAYQCPPPTLFADGPTILQATLIVRSGSSPEISLSTTQAAQLSDGIIFHGFLGDLRRLETFPAWRSARISIRLSGGDYRLGVALDDVVNLTEEEVRRAHNRAAVSCPTTAMLLLNGRQVLSRTANFTRRTDSYGSYAADFENLRVDPSRLPRL